MVCYVHLPWRAGLKGTEAFKEWSCTVVELFCVSYITVYCSHTWWKSLTVPEGGWYSPPWDASTCSPVFGTLCPLRAAAVDECDCDKLDFVAAKALNKEGLNQFVQDRTIIAALNDRLVRLIELVRTNIITAPNDASALYFPSAVSCLCSW